MLHASVIQSDGDDERLDIPTHFDTRTMGDQTYVRIDQSMRTIKLYTGEEDLVAAPPTTNILPW